MTTALIRPAQTQRADIRCNVGDAIVANLAVHLVFFFERHLDAAALRRAFAEALTVLPVFAGRIGVRHGRMRIRCDGQGVPFTTASSSRTLADAIRSMSQDRGAWLVDPVNGAAARWGLGPLCTARITHLAGEATAIGFSWHHVVGDMQTAMHLMNAWVAAAAGQPVAEPLVVEDRAAYLDDHLPPDGTRTPGVRCMGLAETARSAAYLATRARKQRTLSLYFGEDEIERMREAYGGRVRLSANDIVCAHVAEALMAVDPAVNCRTLAIAVNARNRCGLDPMLVGNIITTLNLDVHRGELPGAIAERIRHGVEHFADEHCDMRVNQAFLDAASALQAARCVSTAFNPARWNLLVSNWSGFGMYRVQFENTPTSYCAPVMRLPVAGLGALLDGPGGSGLVFQISLPPKAFRTAMTPMVAQRLHRFGPAAELTVQ